MAKKAAVVVPEVVEENRAVVPAQGTIHKAQGTVKEGVVVKTIAKQIEVVRGAELRSNFEKLKLGAMVSQAVTLLGMDSKGGNGSKGDGVKGWWEKNFKDKDGTVTIPYQSLMRWVEAAKNLPRLMGKGVMDGAKILDLLAKDPKKAVGNQKKILESAEKVANGMTMRQMLLWGGDAEPDRRGGKGRPKGTKADLSKKPDSTDTIAAARAVWSGVIVPADRTLPALKAAVKLLNAQDVENAKIVLQNLMDLLKEREDELKTEIR